MFFLTHQEKKVLLFIGILILAGSILRFFNVNSKEEPSRQKVISSPLMVNVNIASKIQLEKLPGIGPAIANRIIEHRRKYGNFNDLDDLEKIKGIGSKKIEKLKGYTAF